MSDIETFGYEVEQNIALLSIAISLKRIADILDGSCKEFTPLDKLAAAAVIYKDNNEDSY